MKRLIILAAIGALFAVGVTAAPVGAQSIPVFTPRSPIMLTTARMTSFKPAQHGFKFANSFKNNFVSEFDIRTGGLCGGMVYAALDYWKAGKPIPKQSWLPTEGSTLQSYIYNRQVISIVRNADQWIELGFNPDGARNDEYWRWGLEGKRGGRIDTLKRYIDRGQPVPLSLKGCSEGCKGDHQVLAIGYDMGRYKGDLGAHKSDFKIFIYDPNVPNKTRTLIVDEANKKFKYKEDGDSNWRTYFVDQRWRAGNPPTIAQLQREFLVTFETGEDDLRGGRDNVNMYLKRRSGGEIAFSNVNKGKRWISNSTQTVAVSLPARVSPNDITGIRVVHIGPGSRMDADNWDLRSIRVESGDLTGKKELFRRGGTPLFRFTRSRRTNTWDFAALASADQLMFYFLTGNDDLRGGNDNVNVVLLLNNGREHRINTINKRRKWENGAQIDIALPLPRGVSHTNIRGMRIETTFSGGMGGDNWNLAQFSLRTREGGTERAILSEGNSDGATLYRFKADSRSKTWMR